MAAAKELKREEDDAETKLEQAATAAQSRENFWDLTKMKFPNLPKGEKIPKAA